MLVGYRCAIRTLDADILVVHNRITDATKLVHPMGLEVEFPLNKIGAGLEVSMGTNLGVTAQTLRHLGILSRNPMWVSYRGMDVLVPTPEAYVVQKMVVNRERGAKSDKDAAAIANLWPHLEMGAFEEVRSSLTRRELAQLGLIRRGKEGRGVVFEYERKRNALMKSAMPFLVSPVSKTVYARRSTWLESLPDAGESALSSRSMLALPPIVQKAVAGGRWRRFLSMRFSRVSCRTRTPSKCRFGAMVPRGGPG